MARTRSQSDRAKRAISKPKAIIVSAVALVCLGFAVPRVGVLFVGDDPPPPASMAAQFQPTSGGPVHRAVPVPVPAPVAAGDPGSPAPKPDPSPKARRTAVAAPTGDIGAALELRWSEFEPGDRVLANVRFRSGMSGPIFLPAGGEPNRGLAVVIEDAEGAEVRRIVETAKPGQLPRRLEKLAPSEEVAVPVVLVSEDDQPLAPGAYAAYAEVAPDPTLDRLGLPTWTAPNGPIRTEPVRFIVKPRSAK